MRLFFIIVSVSFFLSGCSSLKQMHAQQGIAESLQRGNINDALIVAEEGLGRETLYHLEKPELLLLDGGSEIDESIVLLSAVDRDVNRWTKTATETATKASDSLLGFFVTENISGTYYPKAYEVSFLSYRMALLYALKGDWESAFVASRRLVDRESHIARTISKKLIRAKQNTSKEEVSIEEIQGYPIHVFKNPAVLSLKNAYQSAAAHYLSAFIFESERANGLAAPAYRLAAELQPNSLLSRSGLQNLDQARRQKGSDILFVIEAGSLPVVYSRSYQYWAGHTGFLTLGLPVVQPRQARFSIDSIVLNDQPVQTELMTDMSALMSRWYSDAMGQYILRAVTRAIAFLTTSQLADDNSDQSALELIGSLALSATASYLTQPDVRHWLSIPGQVYMGRAKLNQGTHHVRFKTSAGVFETSIDVDSFRQVIYLRFLNNQLKALISRGAS